VKYMLDTNICIALIRQKSLHLINKLTNIPLGDIGISSITMAELVHGVEKSAMQEQNREALNQFLLPLEVADFDQQSALIYGKIRADLEGTGQGIGPMDTLIASHALSLDAILVTNNMREFSRVPKLCIEDWLTENN
jgi:tRNA(fMet)-specific endonuclease VapC